MTPVTVLTGFLGAGKTTILSQLLERERERKLVVIVNEAAPVSVDGERLRATGAPVGDVPGGCVCCSRRGELLEQLRTLIDEHRPERVIVEASGAAEPAALVHALAHEEGLAAEVDLVVGVVDGVHALDQLRAETGPVFTAQVELADRLIITKCDLGHDLEQVEGALRGLAPRAELARSAHGDLDSGLLLVPPQDTHRPRDEPGWLAAIRAARPHAHDTLGLTSWVYRHHRPFHPERLDAVLSKPWPGVLRSKGWTWLAPYMDRVFLWSQAGRIRELTPRGRWWATKHPVYWPTDPTIRSAIDERVREPYGDRRQEIVFLGTAQMDTRKLAQDLDGALVDDASFSAGPLAWVSLQVPTENWPWRRQSPEKVG